jgi:hypothetical protein
MIFDVIRPFKYSLSIISTRNENPINMQEQKMIYTKQAIFLIWPTQLRSDRFASPLPEGQRSIDIPGEPLGDNIVSFFRR